jgi:putative hemolysin
VPLLLEFQFWLLAMVALACVSAFCSCSEAALFYLRRQDVRAFRSGNRTQRIAANLLDRPAQLLTAILFLNLMTNVSYFAISSVIAIKLEADNRQAEAGTFAGASLFFLIFFSEMLPKSLGVLRPRMLAALSAIPLAVVVRIFDPVLRVFQVVNLISRRIIWPNFEPEPYLELGDLERAIEMSTTDAALLDLEQEVLQNIVSLSHLRVDEMMRPRTQFLAFRPPISLSQLDGRMTPSGYVLVAESGGEDVVAAIPLQYLFDIPSEHLEYHAESVVYIPWCATGAAALEEMRRTDRRVAAVINELGETIGIVTFDDILETIFSPGSSRSQRLLKVNSIEELPDGYWQVTGMTSIRRISRHFNLALPPTVAVTVAGMLQEVLQRLPAPGDDCEWGPFHWKVVSEGADRGPLLVKITRLEPAEEER